MTPTRTDAKPTIALRRDIWLRECVRYGYDQNGLAEKLGCNRSHLNELLNGRRAPGAGFIARTLATFPGVRFEELFQPIVPPS